MNCVICNYYNPPENAFKVKEMMLGTGDEFEYFQCENCKALQIKNIPNDISKYYENYYTANKKFVKINNFRKTLWLLRTQFALTKFYPLLETFRYNAILHWVHISKLKKMSMILDVGCGNGDILYEFSKHGFRNLFGIDPNLVDSSTEVLHLEKTDLFSFQNKSKFDLIMFNHSFEHIIEQHATLKKAISLLNVDGTIMIRIPVVNKAFEMYREHWVQIDAPRHFVVHSLTSINLLCKMNNADIYHRFFDSTAFQFLGSEQFKRGISSYAALSYKINVNQSLFDREDLINYDKMAKDFNKRGLGDQAAFFIRKIK